MPVEFHLNDWLVRPDLNLVTKAGRTVRIEPKAMQVLVLLATHPDELLCKQSFLAQVWAGTFVSDDVLVRCVSELRKVLEADPRHPSLIQTVNRGGYRLTAQVCWKQEKRDEPVAVAEATQTRKDLEPEKPGEKEQQAPTWEAEPGVSRHRVTVFVAIALAGLFLAYLSRESWLERDEPDAVAVLPYQNLSGDSRQDEVAAAMTTLLTTQLSKTALLEVTSGAGLGQTPSARRIAARQAVDAVVEGTVLAIGERTTIRTHLIDARTERHLWCGTYERQGPVATIPYADVASEACEEIRRKLTPDRQ